MIGYIQLSETRTDGLKDCFQTIEAEVIEKSLWWQTKGLSFTATGYGSRIPTTYMIKHNNRFKRVYCRIFSNSGTLFIGKSLKDGLIVNIDRG